MNFKKILPYAVLAIALIGLWFQYQSYSKSKGCNCGGHASGMID
ncbi:hypothetical protein [Flavilitoribacter nigricans]|nr:hypothetical protein [Flavilitoribacter nigricans]